MRLQPCFPSFAAKILTALTLLTFSDRAAVAGQEPSAGDARWTPETFTGLALRGIGPAVTSGRVVDLAVDPADKKTWYVAVASGGVWKTTNAGTSFTPVFDAQGSYSIGCVAIDPRNRLTVWVGAGENNSQRSVAYGDGVYKSVDGGKSWENVGLRASEHIGKIVIDPRDSDVVWVAAQGPLWKAGGDRGLYKTTDGGKSWSQVLRISDDTGVSDVVLDPRDPDRVLAAAYQRRRHVWTLINGGPESGLHRSLDGGKSWRKVDGGLPKEELGRIGLAVAPSRPDVVYAVVEAANKSGGFFRSTDGGADFEKMSDYVPGGPQYYNELIVDPKNPDRVYSMDVFMQVTHDGGKTFANAGEQWKHVDNHALWIDPDDSDHLINGSDGGVYESWDRARTWNFKPNLPVTQFYKVAVDEAKPFYGIYGGTQDNFTLGGPSRTDREHGITNADWYVTVGGDGFQTQVDPTNPDIVYSQSQYGELVRFDRRSGERVDIQPQPDKGEAPPRWNWDSPLIISPHSPSRLYFAANRLYRSDDRGDSWRAVSPDLTRQIDRNRLAVMGRVWSVDAVAKNTSTSFYGNIVSLAESPRKEGLLYVGTDDGLVQTSEDGGRTWRAQERFPGVPERAYVARLAASQHDDAVVYAALDNHKMGDFKPYVLRSADRGATWVSVAGDLPPRGTVYCLAEDHVDPKLLFAGTEFGVFFTVDGGRKWVQLKGGMPVIQVRDLAIQKRENDLVVATFGRGFYVLDDYAPLRRLSAATLEREAVLFGVKKAWMFVPSQPHGLRGKSFFGESFYAAPNPPFGAVFTYYLRDELKTRKKRRQAAEQEAAKKGKDVFYPPWAELRAEDREEDPAILLTVSDAQGNVVRRLTGPVGAGFHRVAWDLRYAPANPTDLRPPRTDNPFVDPPQGPLAVPGTYTVAMAKRVDGALTPLGTPETFAAEPLGFATLPAADRAVLLAFQKQTERLQRAVLAAAESVKEAEGRIKHLKRALHDAPAAPPRLEEELRAVGRQLHDLKATLSGDETVVSRNEPAPAPIADRVNRIVGGHWAATSAATATQRRQYQVAAAEFAELLPRLRRVVLVDLRRVEEAAEAAGAPWTPGRFPEWKPEAVR